MNESRDLAICSCSLLGKPKRLLVLFFPAHVFPMQGEGMRFFYASEKPVEKTNDICTVSECRKSGIDDVPALKHLIMA